MDSKSDILLHLKWLSGPLKSNFLVYRPIWIICFLWLGNSMVIPKFQYCTLPQMTHWTTKVFSSNYSLFSSDFIKDISFVYYIKNIPWIKSTQIKLNHKFFVDKYIMLALKLKWVVISFIQLNINSLGISLTN